MSDEITLTLSRADAERLRLAITRMSGVNYVYDAEGEPWEMSWDAVAALDAALAAPAEGPERAATGELEALTQACEDRGWEWQVERRTVPERGIGRVWEASAMVKPVNERWIGMTSTTRTPGELLREALRAAGVERGA